MIPKNVRIFQQKSISKGAMGQVPMSTPPVREVYGRCHLFAIFWAY